ncbi:hypothetical protein P7C70_g4920, partial [Phenoliferia sp. Uapishka_3]
MQDLVAGLHFIKDAFPEIDPERMAMLGASYGGYMANWIQGHNDQMGFKAIVCHDGVFSTSGTWFGTEELYFPEREFGGTPWEVPDNYSRTPQLVIHGGRDYRLNESEGAYPGLVSYISFFVDIYLFLAGLGVFNTFVVITAFKGEFEANSCTSCSLQRLGVPSRFVYFGSENHWVLEPHNGVAWHKEVFRWIDEWTAEDDEATAEVKAE